ncbi:hypothetical protein D5S18_28285 [Nocardia panacis]|uniref:Uncharacterized protein n=1 Tax=Nocardia panacis TaxID=2340916 RepID=A0A3A4JM18_9NOCA|nr:hypothetical protein [Nocardia panacis]RJO69801.1 hypothetical protein D5S18_28285 [Nocardia panacis]
MSDILDVLYSRCAEAAGEAILTGESHPTLTLTTGEVADLLIHISTVNRRFRDLITARKALDHRANQLRKAATEAVGSFERIRSTLDHPAARHGPQTRLCSTIADTAAGKLTAATLHTEGSPK